MAGGGRAGAGVQPLSRLLLVPHPGEAWPSVTVLAEGVDPIVLRPSTPVTAAAGRYVTARLRQGRTAGKRHTAALAVVGSWPVARVALRTETHSPAWTGQGDGVGRFKAMRTRCSATVRGTGRSREVEGWLPSADSTVTPVDGAVASIDQHRLQVA